jgi:hypothetical protein
MQELMAWFGAAGAADTCPWDRLDVLAAETTALCCGVDGAACPAAAAADGGVSTPDACALPCAVAMHDFTTRCGAALRLLNPQGTGYAALAAFEGQCVQETEDNGEAVLHALGTAQCPADGEAAAPAPAAGALADGEKLIAFKNSGNGGDLLDTWVAGTNPCTANWYGVTCDPAGAAVIGVALPGIAMGAGVRFTPFDTLTGDAGLLGRLPHLAHLDLYQTAVTGDLADLRGCTALYALRLSGCAGITGDVSDLGTLVELRYLSLRGTAAAGWPLAVAGGCTFADDNDYYGGRVAPRAEYNAAYAAGYTC